MLDKRRESTPEITVFIPTFNRLDLLKRAVGSVLDCGAPVHLHILNNCSSDGTTDWLKNFCADAPISVSVTNQSHNVGAIENFANGFSSVGTEYFVPLADDDELVPGFLPIALDRAKEHPDVIAVVGARAFRKDTHWKADWSPYRSKGLIEPSNHIKEILKYGHYVTWSAILWKTSPIQNFELFAKARRFGLPSDIYFQFAAFLSHAAYIEAIPAATFSLSEGQACSQIGMTPESISDFGLLADSMVTEIVESELGIQESEARELVSIASRHWASFIRENREKAMSRGSNLRSEECLTSYVKHILPHAGLTNFPFGAEIDSFNSRPSKKTHKGLRRILSKLSPFASAPSLL